MRSHIEKKIYLGFHIKSLTIYNIKVVQASKFQNRSKFSPLVIYSLHKNMVLLWFWARFLRNSACFNKKKFQDKNLKLFTVPYKPVQEGFGM
jgi:hypothetical protein